MRKIFSRSAATNSSRSMLAKIEGRMRKWLSSRRGGAQRRPAQFPNLFFAKGRSARDSRLLVSCRLFHHRQLGARRHRRGQLALLAVAGNSHAHPRAPLAEGKTASAEESALLGYFSDPQRDHARDRERGLRARERRWLGLGRLPAILSFVLQGR